MFGRHAFLGQVPLVLGPGSWGFGQIPMFIQPVPPFYGEWSHVDPAGNVQDSGREGPFDTPDEAFQAAAAAAQAHGVTNMPLDGFVQVKDSRGQPVGPVA